MFDPGLVLLCLRARSFTPLVMLISIMMSNECSLTFAGSVIYFNKSVNHSMYFDLGFKERVAAIPSMIHFAIWGTEEDTEFDDFII